MSEKRNTSQLDAGQLELMFSFLRFGCRKKNSYPGAETDKGKLNSVLEFGAFLNGATDGGYIK